MVIEIDSGSGFCFGVTTAIRKAEEELAQGKKNSIVWATSYTTVWNVTVSVKWDLSPLSMMRCVSCTM
jgi:4-hydroxy-3-methylbut-2-enyl diphosphate reductase IspH